MKLPDVSRYFGPGVPGLRFICIVLVVLLLHVFLVCLLMSGVPREVAHLTGKSVDTVLIQRVIAPPKPPSQAQLQLQVPAPSARMPPSPDVLEPDAVPQVTRQAPVMQSVVASPAPAAVIAAAPPPSEPLATAPQHASIMLVCPKQVAPEMPRRALVEGIEGLVRAQIQVKDSRILGVTILSGPRVFHAAVREAIMQYSCSSEGLELIATQDFNFKLE